jgi:hypothetical protein
MASSDGIRGAPGQEGEGTPTTDDFPFFLFSSAAVSARLRFANRIYPSLRGGGSLLRTFRPRSSHNTGPVSVSIDIDNPKLSIC